MYVAFLVAYKVKINNLIKKRKELFKTRRGKCVEFEEGIRNVSWCDDIYGTVFKPGVDNTQFSLKYVSLVVVVASAPLICISQTSHYIVNIKLIINTAIP